MSRRVGAERGRGKRRAGSRAGVLGLACLLCASAPAAVGDRSASDVLHRTRAAPGLAAPDAYGRAEPVSRQTPDRWVEETRHKVMYKDESKID